MSQKNDHYGIDSFNHILKLVILYVYANLTEFTIKLFRKHVG